MYKMIKITGIVILSIMLIISMGLQIIAINQKYNCNVKKSFNYTLNYCEIFMDTNGKRYYKKCCSDLDYNCNDYSKYHFG